MIDKRQLRIGNILSANSIPVTIKEIGEFEASIEGDEGLYTYDQLDGVELSPEILEACGFVQDEEDAQIFNYKSIYLYYSLKANSFNLWRNDDSITLGICLCDNIKYLHQLQNFISIYTGRLSLGVF